MAIKNFKKRNYFLQLILLVIFLVVVTVITIGLLDYWLWILGVTLILLLKPWNWKNPNITLGGINKKMWILVLIAVSIIVLLFAGGIIRELVGVFWPKQIDKSAPAATTTRSRLEHGDHLFIVGEQYTYYHSNVPEFFYPAKDGQDARIRIRSIRNPALYHDFIVVREENGTILDSKCVTLFNNLDDNYGDYTVECLDHDVLITYSDKNLADSKK